MFQPRIWIACALSAGLCVLSVASTQPSLKITSPEQLEPGMRGYGLSVFQGTEPERFDVEVIGVLDNFRPDQDLVLVKTPHPLLEHTGSVAGMSGSPVYVHGGLVGAYAYGWSFGKDPIAGVTPISNMLRELQRPLRTRAPVLAFPLPEQQARRPDRTRGYLGGEGRDAFWSLSRHAPKPASRDEPRWVQTATPLLVGGFTADVAAMLRDRFAPLGLQVIEAASGGGAADRAGPRAYQNGSSIAVSLIRGDVQATGVGTVTHVDGKRAVAFGHPMLGAGEVALPTATSRVLHVLASERTSFKIAEAISPLGALVHDRQSAIVVDTDVAPLTIPVRVRLRGAPGAPRELWRMETVSHHLLTPALVLSALANAVSASVNDVEDVTYRAETEVVLAKYGPQRVVDEGFSPLGVAHLGALTRLRMFDLLEVAFNNPFEHVAIERIDITLDLAFERDVVELIGAQVNEEEINPGEPLRVVLKLRPFGGPIERRVVEVPIPEALAGEEIELEIQPGNQVKVEQPVPQNLADALRISRSGLPCTSLSIGVQRKSRSVGLASHVVGNLPGSALDLFSTSLDTSRTPTFVTEQRQLIPMGSIVRGRAQLALTVREDKR